MNIEIQLLRIQREIKERFRDFPNECCEVSSKKIEEMGLEKVTGLFIDDYGLGHNHSWNKGEGKIYDITAYQFSKSLPIIYILDEASPEAKERYIEGVVFMF